MKINKDEEIAEEIVRKALAQILLDSVDSLTNDIVVSITKSISTVVSDYMISFRKYFLENMEFRTIKNASIHTGIPMPTLYTWINRKMLTAFPIDSKTHVSLSQIRSISRRLPNI